MVDDKFDILKSKYSERLRQAERQVSELKEKLRLIKELEVEANAQAVNGADAVDGQYKTATLTPAIFDALSVLAKSDWITGGAIRKHLLAHGFQPKGNHFSTSVNLTLRRLAKNKQIQTKLEEGSRLYQSIEKK